ncbi:protein SEMI-ROLLED LEAF 2 isoform X1 [Brassica rapa]|uniref:protein SEMI-ROLLED LEAF 2 isoform X1 n=1 Tax=Brassica campestris TaxID=3711 RepID=UPI00142E24A9|nr:protein SEMI-ROLLED LEAF 2 isoform X1 [Brassica rapa]
MGAFSRKVVPVCGRLCIFCPALRPRSKQAVKRYKKLIADIFHTPRHQEEAPNDRKIGKLCDYAAKNAVRMPEISDLLEQRCYKELRNENFHSAKIVMCIYRRLLVTCNEQMPLFSSGFLRTVQALLDQTRQVEMQIVGCQSLFEFVNNQTDGSSLFSLEGFLPKLGQLALEVGDDDRSRSLRAAGLQALSAMIWLMGEYSHIPSDFDNVVSGVLENYGHPKKLANAIDNARKWVDEVLKNEGHLAYADSLINVPSWRTVVDDKGELNVKMEDSLDPSFWSKVCLHNMAKLGEDATTMRRILESLFRYFDEGHLWSTENSIALPVLRDLQFLMELSGQRTHFILSMLIKHLDHKSVLKQPSMQLNILEVTSSLAENAKVEHSAAIVSAISDITRHLRKCMHSSLHEANLGTEVANCNRMVSVAIDKCLIQLTKKVGDAGPILDAMALMLENIPAVTDVARNTIASVFHTAQIIASVPNLSYQNKAFPEALFHQLLKAMVHPDHKTRIGAHRIFSVVLVPTSVCPHPSSTTNDLKKEMGLPRSLSRTASVFSSSTALFEKLRKENILSVPTSDQRQIKMLEEESGINSGEILDRLTSPYSQAYRSWNQPVTSVADNSELDAVCIRLSSHQIGLLLSSIWAQSISPSNTPDNYEAIANTYSLVLLFCRVKNSSQGALIRSFQMALSLRDISLMEGGPLPPSRRRSLFTLATSMVLFSSKAFNLFSLADITKVALQGPTLDPFLHLVEDHKLKAVNPDQLHIVAYGTEEDDASALDTLSKIAVSTEHSRGTLVYEIVKSLENMCSSEMEKMQEQLLTEFMPDDACPLGTRFLEDTQTSFQADFGDVKHQNLAALFSHEDQEFGNVTETVAGNNPLTVAEVPDLLTVNQILESIVETTRQMGLISFHTAADASYKEMTLHCEDLLTGKQQKISSLFNSQLRHKSSVNGSPGQHDKEIKIATFLPMINSAFHTETQCYSELQAYKLPASTPYDNFLKAAGC